MKTILLLWPFPTLAACVVLLLLTPAVWVGILFLIAFLGCLAAVPLLSRIKLIYGYLGLLFLLLTLTWLTLDPNKMENTVTVVEEGTITLGNKDAVEADEIIKCMNDDTSKQETAPPASNERSSNR